MDRLLMAVLLVWGLVCTGCQATPEKHYPIQAEVISVDPQNSIIVVKHGEIPGLMPAMSMGYKVADPQQIATLGPRDKITADLVVSENKGQLEKIVLVEKTPPAAPATTSVKTE
jgi:Cu/Ag efflux protein CusF